MGRKAIKIVCICTFFALLVLSVSYCLGLFDKESNYSKNVRAYWNEDIDESYVGYRIINHWRYDEFCEIFSQIEREEWKAVCPDERLISQLPLEGLTRKELLERAKENPDACLLLSLHDGKSLQAADSYAAYQQKKYWLERAYELRRPGARFLLDIFHEYERQLPSKNFPIIRKWNGNDDISLDFVRSMDSYGDMVSCLEQKDWLFLKALCDMDQRFLFFQEVEDVLYSDWEKKEIHKGEERFVPFIMNSLLHEGRLHVLKFQIEDELRQKKGGFFGWLSNYIPVKKHKGVSKTRSSAIQSIDYAAKAADDGDLNAMYLWLKVAPSFIVKYDRDTWIRIRRYSDQLLMHGYAPFVSDMLMDANHSYQYILKSYYSPQSVDDVLKKARISLEERGDFSTLLKRLITSYTGEGELMELARYPNFLPCGGGSYGDRLFFSYKGKEGEVCYSFDMHEKKVVGDEMKPRFYIISSESSERSVDIICLLQEMSPSFLYDSEIYSLFFDEAVHKESQRIIVGEIRSAAESGDPQAQYMLAKMIIEGLIPDACELQAIALLEKAWESVRKQNPEIVVFDRGLKRKCWFSSLIMEQLILLYTSKEKESYDPQRAFLLASDYFSSREHSIGSLSYYAGLIAGDASYYMGLMHEYGYGTEVDQEKAASFYEKEACFYPRSIYTASSRALARMYEEGRGKEKSAEKALRYYLKSFRDIQEAERWVMDHECLGQKIGRLKKLEKEEKMTVSQFNHSNTEPNQID